MAAARRTKPATQIMSKSVYKGRVTKPKTKSHVVESIKLKNAVSGPGLPRASSPELCATVKDKPFSFLQLPGELRNKIYAYAITDRRQALVAHLPRRATLRPRQQQSSSRRHVNRSYIGLTQVCRQVRHEYRPLYLRSQEIGLDLTDVKSYLEAFYGGTPAQARLGNFTIAISGKVSTVEKSPTGIDVWPLLDIWANSDHVEAGFGRYFSKTYDAQRDSEAKDLYRLFGRMVLQDRKCSTMNRDWRMVLRGRKLAEVRIHRAPAGGVKPFIHILYKPEHKEEWMTGEISEIPNEKITVSGVQLTEKRWLRTMGFVRMEHFEVKVGVLGGVTRKTASCVGVLQSCYVCRRNCVN